jgi:hypothetical protein
MRFFKSCNSFQNDTIVVIGCSESQQAAATAFTVKALVTRQAPQNRQSLTFQPTIPVLLIALFLGRPRAVRLDRATARGETGRSVAVLTEGCPSHCARFVSGTPMARMSFAQEATA